MSKQKSRVPVIEGWSLLGDAENNDYTIIKGYTTLTADYNNNAALTVTQQGTGYGAIITGGYVGIATTTPSYPLHVWGSAGFGTSTTPTLYVDSGNGRVGIGTTTPSQLLDVNGLTIWNEGTNAYYGNPDNFNDETAGAITSAGDMDFIDGLLLQNNCTAELLAEFDDHKNVLALRHDDGILDPSITHYFPNGAELSGTREFWFGTSDNSGGSRISIGSTMAILLEIRVGTFQYYDGGWQDTGVTTPNDTLFHHKIVFDSVTDTFDWAITDKDGNILYNGNGLSFWTGLSSIDGVYIQNLQNIPMTLYFDAWGDPADANYDEGDNWLHDRIVKTDSIRIGANTVYTSGAIHSISDFVFNTTGNIGINDA